MSSKNRDLLLVRMRAERLRETSEVLSRQIVEMGGARACDAAILLAEQRLGYEVERAELELYLWLVEEGLSPFRGGYAEFCAWNAERGLRPYLLWLLRPLVRGDAAAHGRPPEEGVLVV